MLLNWENDVVDKLARKELAEAKYEIQRIKQKIDEMAIDQAEFGDDETKEEFRQVKKMVREAELRLKGVYTLLMRISEQGDRILPDSYLDLETEEGDAF